MGTHTLYLKESSLTQLLHMADLRSVTKLCPTWRLDVMPLPVDCVLCAIIFKFHAFYDYSPEAHNTPEVMQYLISTLDKV